ncbi:sigma-70 family RNA polymerase sigma factor [Nitrolancea hollandica]|uniref:sigma-70 family RNA polymerase sigma factor n=1 Tax=Nitrolancea hollandica TaxID=1206749 RepID=UPI00058D0B3C|nr:sigma-70 family RNA polymerase sigma factor [Nitrolancea hollandica]
MREDLRQLTDEELVRRMDQGDIDALEVLYDRYSRAVYSFATRIVGDRLLAEEVLQEVFTRSWQQAGRFEFARGSYASWLLSITHNLAIDEIRKRQRRPQRADMVDVAAVLQGQADVAADVEEAAEASEMRERIRTAMEMLPEAQRVVIELAYFQGLTQREIAALLNEPLGTVKTRMRLGMQKLKEFLGTQEGAQI